jgi:hypothetical protein
MVRTPSSGLSPRYVEELSAEPLVDEGDEIEGTIDRQARRVAILISAGAMGVLILIALLLRQLTI